MTYLAALLLVSSGHAATASAREAPPAEVVHWLEGAASPVASLELGADPADLAALKRIVGDARIVAIGEATHGSHEFFAFKARAFEFLARECGFTDFVMESDWAAARVANAWVERGEGDLDTALSSLAGLWRTEEYRALLEWMRAWNADPAHARKLRIHGMDLPAQGQELARHVREALARVDPDVAEAVAPVLERLGNAAAVDDADIEGVLGLFDELHDGFLEKGGEAEWELARQRTAVLVQRLRSSQKRGLDQMGFRDRCMADNVRWIARQAGPDGRVVVSAHNGHVSRDALARVEGYGPILSVGRALVDDAKEAGGEDLSLVVVGSAFAHGGFRAYGAGSASGGGLQPFAIAEPDAHGIEAQLVEAGLTRVLVDVAAAPAEGPVRAWLDTPRTMRGVGGLYDATSGDDLHSTTLPTEFDALFFVREVTPSLLLPAK
jgi:erythromycin esterase